MNNITYKFITNIRFSDTDKYAHVNNGKYFDYFEEARSDWYYNSKMLYKWTQENNIQLVVAEQSCKYRMPILHPNKIEITQTIKKISAASIHIYYEIRLENSQIITTTADVTLACYNSKTQRLQRIPQEIKEAYK